MALVPIRWPRSEGSATATPLAAKAEAILGLQLVCRHRAVRLAALLATGITAIAAASSPSADRLARVMIVVGGTLAAVSASRLLAPGPALAAARMVVAPWWLPPVGRLCGALCAVVPATLGTGLALLAAGHEAVGFARTAAAATLCAATITALVMALAPLLGASAAATLGLLAAWVGAAPPSALAALFSDWPLLARVVGWAWSVLPLPWRALRWLDGGGARDALLFVAWGLAGIGVAGARLHVPRGRSGVAARGAP